MWIRLNEGAPPAQTQATDPPPYIFFLVADPPEHMV